MNDIQEYTFEENLWTGNDEFVANGSFAKVRRCVLPSSTEEVAAKLFSLTKTGDENKINRISSEYVDLKQKMCYAKIWSKTRSNFYHNHCTLKNSASEW